MKFTLTSLLLTLTLGFTGCQVPPPASTGAAAQSKQDSGPVVLREGDTIRIAFPGSPNLDTQQTIRRDGRITLTILGEFVVAGKTPSDLEKALVEAYANQIVSKEISVTVIQSVYPVFVSGAVMRPGKIMADRPLTALEAVMEAGGFNDMKADKTRVTVIRNDGGQAKHYYLDLKAVLEGQSTEQFYLRPSDIVVVPERFSLF
ncbi:polysaccharide biosynthesis/export family protein [Nibricoccus sp. IMCC34717]|uniref:polysaccharide biosynthesis/export family protein n=1 Tax=Nibricoccus sp. IMCC34717 TaxID=3034021 RepID=UPI00384C09CA